MIYLILMIILSYLMGAIPTSVIAARLLKGIDIREHGSGNAGATNVFRVLGWKAGLVVLLIDMLKGWVPVVWFSQFGVTGMGWELINAQIVAGLSAVFGHIWTIFAEFKGGKGVGTGAGMLIGMAPLQVGICLIAFVVVVAITRFVSLGSILAAAFLPIIVYFQTYLNLEVPSIQLIAITGFIAALIIFTHRTNISRLLKGEENKIDFQKKGSAT